MPLVTLQDAAKILFLSLSNSLTLQFDYCDCCERRARVAYFVVTHADMRRIQLTIFSDLSVIINIKLKRKWRLNKKRGNYEGEKRSIFLK
jgi:hypothetical protein